MELRQLELKIPPVIVFLIALGAIYAASLFSGLGMLIDNRITAKAIAYGLSALGIVIGIAGVITFKRAKTTVNPLAIDKASNLVKHGIFKYSRNPMYLGLLLVLLAAAFYVNAHIVLAFIILFGFVAYMNAFQIKPEERMLTQLFGDPYRRYLHTTRRWL